MGALKEHCGNPMLLLYKYAANTRMSRENYRKTTDFANLSRTLLIHVDAGHRNRRWLTMRGQYEVRFMGAGRLSQTLSESREQEYELTPSNPA